jgi:AcrR family transcriptional regulator
VDERRDMILEVAVPLLAEHGQNVTTKQIADAAGIAEGTIFRVFDDKQELCMAAVARYMDPEPIRVALQQIDLGETLEEKVRQVVVLLRSRFAGIMGIMHSLGMSTPPPSAVERKETMRAEAGTVLAEILESERGRLRLDSAKAASLVRLVVFASEIPVFSDSDPLTTDDLVDFILRGIAREEG